MTNLRLKLFIPTLLTVAFCLGAIAYISGQQYLSFRADAAQTTRRLTHEMEGRLLAIQASNLEIADLLANNWGFLDHAATGAVDELLDQIVPFTVHKSIDLINVYDASGALLACAENPGVFGNRDEISNLLPRLKNESGSSPLALLYHGKLALIVLKRLEGNYGPIGFLAVGRYLAPPSPTEFDALYQEHSALLRFSYQGKQLLTLGSAAQTTPPAPKTTAIVLPSGFDDSGALTVQLAENVSRTEEEFWHRFLVITVVFSLVSLIVVVFSRKLTLEVTDELARARDELELRVEERTGELRKTEERFRTLVNSLDALVYVADMESYEILLINDYGQKIWGNLVGKTCWKALQSGQTGPCEFCTNYRLLDGNGTPTGSYVWEFQNTVDREWYECRDQAILWPDGRYVRMEIATNITQRKEAQRALAEEKERLAVTLRSIGDGVITTDTAGRVLLINKVAEQMTGWRSDEATGRPLAEVFHIVDELTGEPCQSPVEKVLDSGKIVGLANHTALIARDGTSKSIADSGAPIRDRESRTIGVVLVFRDISEQLRTEKELLKIRKLESIGILAGGIAHDFNNILAAILGNINLTLLDADIADTPRRRLLEAERASLRARDLTQQLLTFAKGGEPVKETASLAEVVRESADFMLRGNKVACRYSFADDLWLVDIDKGQISQVVQNLILNASQAMAGGGTVEVGFENATLAGNAEAGALKAGNYVKMTVKDTGVGIPANVIDKIFDPYFSTKQQGSGLGLAITHSIVSKHDGRITVHSNPGLGTTFTIYLPASARDSISAPEPELTDPTRGKTERVMVMDDEEQIREMTQAMLGQMGYEVVLARNGDEAVQLYREALSGDRPIDIILMDLTIPGGMGGKKAVREILAINPDARVIVSSGYSTDPIMASFREYGFCGAIAKPYLMEDLAKALKSSTAPRPLP